MLIVTFGYILLGLFIWRIESVRIRKYGPDLFTLCIFILAIQIVFPGLFLTAVIGLNYDDFDTGVPFFNKVLTEVGLYESLLTLLLLVLFLLSLYITWFFIHSKINLHKSYVPKIRIIVSRWRWFFVMIIGLLGSLVLLKELGGYNNLVLFRTDWASPSRNFVTANLFSLTTTYMILSVLGVMIFWRKKLNVTFMLSVMLVIVFSLMTVSRRAFGIAVLLVLFTLILGRKKIYITKISIFIALMFIPIIIFGKRILWLFAHNSDITGSAVSSGQTDLFSGLILFVCNIGISTIESWATLLYLDIPMRLGIDHLLSIARRIPEGVLGLNIDFPERMVRISTTAFVGSHMQDVPPGFIGQMWLDFRLLGPLFWGMLFSIVISFLQIVYNRVGKDLATITLFVVLLYIICLPINNGTLDFVFSIDVFILILFIAFIIKIKRYKKYC